MADSSIIIGFKVQILEKLRLDFGPFFTYAIDMNPTIDSTDFGSITIAGTKYEFDVLIRLDSEVQKRKKKLSKAIYGTSHIISLDEARYVYEDGAEQLLIGAGQFNSVKLSEEAERFFKEKRLPVVLLPTKKAIQEWNKAKAGTIGLFHITC
jgi:hypothetical protein